MKVKRQTQLTKDIHVSIGRWMLVVFIVMSPAMLLVQTSLAQQLANEATLEDEIKPPSGQPIVIGTRIRLKSEILGETRTIRVSLPQSYGNGTQKCGVIYLVDGESFFAQTTALLRHNDNTNMPMIVVGIENTKRTRDLTPPITKEENSRWGKSGGGSEKFRRFIVEELRPFLAKHYRTNDVSVLVGHSFGGLFVWDAMIAQPEAFKAYLVLSPSLWWDKQSQVDRLKSLPSDHGLYERYVFLAMGTEGPSMNEPFDEVIKHLETNSPANFRWDTKQFPEESHWTVVPFAINSGLKHYFKPLRDLSSVDGIASLDELENKFTSLGKLYGLKIQVGAQAIMRLAGKIAADGNIDDADKILGEALERFPKDGRVHKMRVDLLEKAKRYQDALQCCNQAIETLKSEQQAETKAMIDAMQQSKKRLEAAIAAEEKDQ